MAATTVLNAWLLFSVEACVSSPWVATSLPSIKHRPETVMLCSCGVAAGPAWQAMAVIRLYARCERGVKMTVFNATAFCSSCSHLSFAECWGSNTLTSQSLSCLRKRMQGLCSVQAVRQASRELLIVNLRRPRKAVASACQGSCPYLWVVCCVVMAHVIMSATAVEDYCCAGLLPCVQQNHKWARSSNTLVSVLS